ncbi:uncharacterized protein TRIADDRAFT_59992 [Trichoplax adhaerens]|uniref:PGAP2-interacting protein n=1 Tax=Trichoplax adhaerens TaxID=10228 RepID=B3S704_TRIAD|nr:hypothetical protein TRIADDRAFT_59992 [Trichoplax adhaerens]EDV21484.1 hypothetical protein TRIADDRAFT_59992 [Trichoplax adhaerens]|eukprot:XP_002116084.1 hypothetical protein TRIADDRAFT_59992 [Trichoplax adhaerens]
MSSETVVKASFGRCLIAETILGYIWWTFLQGISPTIWLYPLEVLGISGYEAFAVCLFSPILVGLGPIRRLVHSLNGLMVLRLMMILALTSYEAPTTLSRLIAFSIGTGIAMLASCGSFYAQSAIDRSAAFWGKVLGFLALHASRVYFKSLIPALAYTSARNVIIALGIIATLDRRSTMTVNPPVDHTLKHSRKPFWPLVSLGYGSLLYLIHWIFSEASLVARWGVRPYPDHGPQPYPWGALVLLALTIGVLLSTKFTPVTSPSFAWFGITLLWWLVGCAAFTGLYLTYTYVAFGAGLLLGVFAFSIWPYLFDLLTLCPPARTYGLSLVTYLCFVLYTVWTIAFNFVPGGEYTRETYHYKIIAILVCIGLTIIHYKYPQASSSLLEKSGNSYSCTAFPSLVGNDGKRSPWTSFNKNVHKGLFLILIASLIGFGARYNPTAYERPSLNEPKRFTAMIWNIRYGFDNNGWQSFDRIVDMINNTGSDFVGLMECDCARPFVGNNDLGVFLGEKLGMYVDYGPATRDHTWGSMLLSKYPIVNSEHFLLPSPQGELAPALRSTVNISGDLVDIVVTHMGNDGKLPVVFLGYVTSAPFNRDYQQLTRVGRMKDIDSTDNDRWCLYILYRDLIRLGYARISRGIISDTEVQTAKFEIPSSANYEDNSETTHDCKKVPIDARYPTRFGEVFHGHYSGMDHHYHMSTPKYFFRRGKK